MIYVCQVNGVPKVLQQLVVFRIKRYKLAHFLRIKLCGNFGVMQF